MNVIIGLVLVGVCHWLNAWIQAVAKKDLRLTRWNIFVWKKNYAQAVQPVRARAMNALRFLHIFF